MYMTSMSPMTVAAIFILLLPVAHRGSGKFKRRRAGRGCGVSARSLQEHHPPLFRGRYDSIASADMRRSEERVTYETVSTAINATGSRNKGLSPAR